MPFARWALASLLAALVACAPPVAPPVSLDAAHVTLDPAVAKRQWDRLASLDGDACRAQLKESGARFARMPDQAAPDRAGCGVPHPVVLFRGPTGLAYVPAVHVDCSLALDLVSAERILQDEARRDLGVTIVRARTLGGFACRPKRGWLGATLSEHAFGDAVDLAAFEPARGRPIVVARDFPVGDLAPSAPRAKFLRELVARLRGDTGFTHVITPDFNAAHRDHIHVDRGAPWWMSEEARPSEKTGDESPPGWQSPRAS